MSCPSRTISFLLLIFNLILIISGKEILPLHSKNSTNQTYTYVPKEGKSIKCHFGKNQRPFNILPGFGWDNLANHELGRVMKISYKQCQLSNDGNFLIPDNSILIPIRKSIVQMNSELFDHFSNYSSLTAKSINLEASFGTPNFKISGTFSWEKKDIKNIQMQEKSSISRVQLRYELYKMAFQPDSELSPEFRNRIIDIGVFIKNGKDSLHPQYLSDLLVRDFGTHVIKSVDAGAILSKMDMLKTTYIKKYLNEKSDVSLAASISMAKTLNAKIKGSYDVADDKVNEFNKNCVNSRVDTLGGKPFRSNFTLDDWEETVETNMVAIDRRGEPLYNIITPKTVPEFENRIVHQIKKLVKNSINRYYSANARVGCMNIHSDHFNDDANIDGGLCEDSVNFNYLGGVFQTCEGLEKHCDLLRQKNLLTGDYVCPSGYSEVKLQTALYKCESVCKTGFFSYNCEEVCTYYSLYWCTNDKMSPADEGYLFGGFYTPWIPNPLTHTFACPETYLAFQFGANTKICLSLDKENGLKDSLPFGGLYSCDVGNPMSVNSSLSLSYYELTKLWSKGCHPGYSSHLAIISAGCQISYCTKGNPLSGKEGLPLNRPPFVDLQINSNMTIVKSFKTPLGLELAVGAGRGWQAKEKKLSMIYTILIVAACFIFIGLVIATVVVCTRIYRQKREKKYD